MNVETRSVPYRQAMILYILNLLILGSHCLYGVKASCHAKDNPNGSVTYFLKDSVPDTNTYSWVINDINVAHEDNFDREHVLDYGLSYVTTKKCWKKVEFKDDTGKSISCSHNCNSNSKQSGNGTTVDISVWIFATAAVLLIGRIVW